MTPSRSAAPVVAMAFMTLGVLGYAVADAATKFLVGGYGTWQIVVITRLPSFLLALFLILKSGGRFRTRFLPIHLLRSALVLATIWTFYEALRSLPLADAIAIAFAAPLFVTALSALLLKEQVDRRRWAAVAIGFVGVLVAAGGERAGGGAGTGVARWFDGAVLLVLLSALFYALTLISLRRLSGRESSANILFYGNLLTILAGFYPMLGEWVTPAPFDWTILALQGFGSAFGQFFMIRAFRHGEASLLAPIEYTALIWAILFGRLFFGELPSIQVLVGAVIIIAANLSIAGSEARRARRRPQEDIVPENQVAPE